MDRAFLNIELQVKGLLQ